MQAGARWGLKLDLQKVSGPSIACLNSFVIRLPDCPPCRFIKWVESYLCSQRKSEPVASKTHPTYCPYSTSNK